LTPSSSTPNSNQNEISLLDRLIRWSLHNRLLVLALSALVLAWGGYAITHLPVDVFPDLNKPTISVMTEAEGLAPEETETLVTIPIESALLGLPDVERVRSQSGAGLSIVWVEFDWDTDIYRNRQLVQERLAVARERLPRDVLPQLGPISSIMGEIQLVGLVAEDGASFGPLELRNFADWMVRPRLMSINGISQVIAIGGGVRQYQILLSAEKIQQRQLSLSTIEHSISEISKNTSGGFIDLDQRENLIRIIGGVREKEEILNSFMGYHLGQPVRVRDVATVIEGPRTKRGDASINAQPGVILSVQKAPGASTLDLAQDLDLAFDELERQLPPQVKLHRNLFRQATFIETSIHNVIEALRDGSLLVIVVLMMFLANFRTTAITLTAIPLSFAVSALVFEFMGMTVNTMTLGGLAVAIGELVDDAIVDVENVYRRLRENALKAVPDPILSVVFHASSEVRNSIVIATMIVIAVFFPLFAMSGIEGRLFAPLGVAYVVSILASMFVSLTLTPVLCSYLLGGRQLKEQSETPLARWMKARQAAFLRIWLNRSGWWLAPVALLFLITGIMAIRMDRDFLPQFNEGTATINVILDPGVSLSESNRIGQEAERLIGSVPEVLSVSRRTGRAEMDEHAEGVHYSEIDVDFKPLDQWREGQNKESVLEEIRAQLEKLSGVYFNIGQPISHRLDHLTSGVRAQIALKIFGEDLAELRAKAAEVEGALKDIEGLVDLQVESQALIPQLKIQILREEASRFGLTTGDLAELLEQALQGRVVGQVIEGQRSVDLFLRFDEESRRNPDLISNTIVKVMPDGQRIRVADVADVYEAEGPNLIARENALRRIVVSANTSGRALSPVVDDIRRALGDKVTFDRGLSYSIEGQFESQVRATRLMTGLGILSLILIFTILTTHFKSAWMAGQVMLNVPLALIGGVLAMALTNMPMTVASLLALVTLAGIASRNGIMMLSHYLHLMRFEGEKFTLEMVVRGSCERLIPVMMTALTAILALMPLLLAAGAPGKEILYPLAVVITGGLISSTALDLFVTPMVFWKFSQKAALQSLTKMKSI
jgi:CzcA family heavy metal efflux pump